jgi:hypothetical protein
MVYRIECGFRGELELLQGILVCTCVPEIVLLQTHYSEIQQLSYYKYTTTTTNILFPETHILGLYPIQGAKRPTGAVSPRLPVSVERSALLAKSSARLTI